MEGTFPRLMNYWPRRMEDRAMERKRVKHTSTFEERLAKEAQKFREAAEQEAPGSQARELLARRARQAETALRLSEQLRSPGSQSPK